MFLKKALLFLIAGFAFKCFTLALPIPQSDIDAQIEDLFQNDFSSDILDTPKKAAQRIIDDIKNDQDNSFRHKRTPQDPVAPPIPFAAAAAAAPAASAAPVAPVTFGDLITPSLGGTFDSFVTTENGTAPADQPPESVNAASAPAPADPNASAPPPPPTPPPPPPASQDKDKGHHHGKGKKKDGDDDDD